MGGVVRADQEIRAGPLERRHRTEQELADRLPIAGLHRTHVLGERDRVQRDLGVAVPPEERGALDAERPVAQRGALRADSHDPDVPGHSFRGSSRRGGTRLGRRRVEPILGRGAGREDAASREGPLGERRERPGHPEDVAAVDDDGDRAEAHSPCRGAGAVRRRLNLSDVGNRRHLREVEQDVGAEGTALVVIELVEVSQDLRKSRVPVADGHDPTAPRIDPIGHGHRPMISSLEGSGFGGAHLPAAGALSLVEGPVRRLEEIPAPAARGGRDADRGRDGPLAPVDADGPPSQALQDTCGASLRPFRPRSPASAA